MKKLTLLFLFSLVCGIAFQACDNTKTYAEQLADEKKAIKKYIEKENINVISVEEFEKDTITDVKKNEYVLFPEGLYMQIVDRGNGDTIQNRKMITVRQMEYDIMNKDTTNASNFDVAPQPDDFYYTISGSSIYGQFDKGSWLPNFYAKYVTSSSEMLKVPTGWLIPLRYIKDNAHVKLIVPSKIGHAYAMQYVYPYYYDLRRIQVSK